MTGEASPILDPGLTVDEVMARHPSTMPVFNAFGVDICCGAGQTLREAAAGADVAMCRLLQALDEAVGQAP